MYIDLHAFQIHRTHLVDSNLESVKIQQFVSVVGLVSTPLLILKTRTSPTDHRDAQRHGTGLCICMISFTLVLATGVKLIIIPFASARGPRPPAIHILL